MCELPFQAPGLGSPKETRSIQNKKKGLGFFPLRWENRAGLRVRALCFAGQGRAQLPERKYVLGQGMETQSPGQGSDGEGVSYPLAPARVVKKKP